VLPEKWLSREFCLRRANVCVASGINIKRKVLTRGYAKGKEGYSREKGKHG